LATQPALQPGSELPPRALREALGVSPEQMARLLDVSAKSVERWERDGKLPARTAVRQRLAQLQEIVELGLTVLKAEGLLMALHTPAPIFDGCTGLQLIERGQGQRVVGALAGIYEGVPS
jgi:transcriptional regulator with XRE-family HTH domain